MACPAGGADVRHRLLGDDRPLRPFEENHRRADEGLAVPDRGRRRLVDLVHPFHRHAGLPARRADHLRSGPDHGLPGDRHRRHRAGLHSCIRQEPAPGSGMGRRRRRPGDLGHALYRHDSLSRCRHRRMGRLLCRGLTGHLGGVLRLGRRPCRAPAIWNRSPASRSPFRCRWPVSRPPSPSWNRSSSCRQRLDCAHAECSVAASDIRRNS